jgi:hypothetical protein
MEALALGLVAIVAFLIWTVLRRKPKPGPTADPGPRFEVVFVPAPVGPEHERIDLRGDLPPGHRYLIQGPGLEVVGESRYRAEIERAVGQRPEGHRTIVDAALVAEPGNPYDANAIAVMIAGRRVGYLSRNDAARYQPVMAWCVSEGFTPVVRGDVRGGWQQDDGSWADFGIRLYVSSPDKLIGRTVPPLPVPNVEHPWRGLLIAFTGDSCCVVNGRVLDRSTSEGLARAAGMEVHERVTKKVQLLVDCDDATVSGNERRAVEYGIPVVRERAFWEALGFQVET